MCLYYNVDNCGPGPSREGTWRRGLSTWIQQRMPRIRSDTRASTGGKEMHWRRAAASCVDQVPTSRRTVSCTEALQVHITFLFTFQNTFDLTLDVLNCCSTFLPCIYTRSYCVLSSCNQVTMYSCLLLICKSFVTWQEM